MCDAYSARGGTRLLHVYYTCTRVVACPRTRGVHVDTRVSTVDRRALAVRDPNLNLMRIRYSATLRPRGSRSDHDGSIAKYQGRTR